MVRLPSSVRAQRDSGQMRNSSNFWPRGSNAETPPFRALFSILVRPYWFRISSATMNSPFTRRASRLLLTAAIACASANVAVTDVFAQDDGLKLPKKTDRVAVTKAANARRDRRKARQATAPVAAKTPNSVESVSFIELGERFRAKANWNAAEAAYKEATIVAPRNADALLELGLIYLDRSKWTDAQKTYSQLRAVNPTYAAELLAEINSRQAKLKH